MTETKNNQKEIKVGSYVQTDMGNRIGKVIRIENVEMDYVTRKVVETHYIVEFGPAHDNIITPFKVAFGNPSTLTARVLGIGKGPGSITRIF